MKTKMARFLPLALAILLALSLLSACGGAPSGGDTPSDGGETNSVSDPAVGVYKLASFMGFSVEDFAEMMEEDLDTAKDSFMIELQDGGKGIFTTDGEADPITWSLEGETLYLSMEGDEEPYPATLKDGIITIAAEDVEITLAKEA